MRGRGEIGRRSGLKIRFPWSAGSSPAVRTIALTLALASCGPAEREGPILVSAIGGAPRPADPNRTTLDTPSRLLIEATAQGLVRFDAAGQIEPGLAERWIVSDDGTSYIFRLSDAHWTDGSPVTAPQVVSRLQRALAPASRNPLKPFLSAIDEIVEMTPQVIEVRLSRPRPDLLKLFAQPELAILRAGTAGSGPMRRTGSGAAAVLQSMPDPAQPDPTKPKAVQLAGERAARAVARFVAGYTDIVLGGSFVDWPLVQAAGVTPAPIRIDPAAGLFGLAVVNRNGFLATTENRAAVAQAIDAARVIHAVAPAWLADERLLPEQLDSAAPPALAAWSALPPDQRLVAARARVVDFGTPVRVRVALPAGPGATRLWGQLAAGLLAAGITAERVAPGQSADLRLIDAVAPYDSARWYLATACQPCGAEAQARLEEARLAPTQAERGQRIAAADAALAADVAFIPLARPWRWSLVGRRFGSWQPNPRAAHPLNRLRPDPT